MNNHCHAFVQSNKFITLHLFHFTFTGKWYKIDNYLVPNPYFNGLLYDMHVCPLYGVRRCRHMKPIYKENTMRLSYKIFDVDTFLEVFGDENIRTHQLYSGNTEIADEIMEGATAEELLEAANERGNVKYEERVRPTSRSEVIVGYGEGRATREVELIWWPNMYTSAHGKLTVRFYVSKRNV